jgi:hypothetical protein
MQPIYMVGGGKGGVGKSMVTMALIDYFIQAGVECLLIETDTSNADVYKAYEKAVESKMLDLDESDGWIDLVNICAEPEHQNKTVIINGAARSSDGVDKFGEILRGILPELNRSFVTLWVINTQRDSVELLKDYMKVMEGLPVHVVRNGYFGGEDEFKLYNNSAVKKAVEKVGKSVTISSLAKRVSTVLYNDRKTIAGAVAEMPLGNKAELLRWRGDCKKMFEGIIGKL